MIISYVAVLICAVAALVIGSIWYGPLFGKAWMKIMGVETMSGEEKAKMKNKMWMYYVTQFILSFITAGVLSYHIMNWGDFMATPVSIAVCTWFGFIMTTEAGAALWSGKPSKVAWKMFLISASGQLVTFIVYGLILSYWI